MPYTTGCAFDVFLSYAHLDNAEGPDGTQLVSQIHDHLRSALRQRLGRGADDLRIFFDPILRPNQQLDELLDAASQSAILLVIGSRAWVSRDFTLRELQAFAGANPDPSRMFLIEVLPLHASQSYPPELDRHLRTMFYTVDEGGHAIPLSPISDAPKFRTAVHRLAEQIADRLIAMRSGPLALAPKPVEASPAGAGKPCQVVIAQSTDDLAYETERLNDFLNQAGITTRMAGRLPQGGPEFANGFQDDIRASRLFVQLLGGYRGRRPADLPIGYTMFQAQAAEAAGIEVLQWRRPDLDLSAVDDPEHAVLLDRETVVATTLQEFKDEILARVRPAAAPPAAIKRPPSLVFINAAESDFDVAKAIQKEFAAQRFPVALPSLSSESAADARLELEEFLLESDIIIFLYGTSKPSWIKGQLRLFTKLQHRRDEEPTLVAICTGPPADKEELGFTLPDAREVDFPQSWSMDGIRSLIHELQS